MPPSGERSRCCRGVSLVELLVAASIAGIVLTAAWSWLWNAGAAGRGVQDRAQAATTAAFALRSMRADLRLAARLLPPSSGISPERSLCMAHRHDSEPDETILVVWEPTRRVLWRKAAGTYLADHVERFAATYFDATGRRVAAEELSEPGRAAAVARVSLVLRVRVGTASVEASRDVVVGRG